jgi:uncharacterized protein (DUF433 family)
VPSKIDLYGGEKPEEVPAYAVRDVAYILNIPRSTLRSWLYGQSYKSEDGTPQDFKPLIAAQHKTRGDALSFMDLVEAHVVSSLRRQHLVRMHDIRRALERILEQSPTSLHPLAEKQFAVMGKNLFIEETKKLTSITIDGQQALKKLLENSLKRIERNPAGHAIFLYPFPRFRRPVDWSPPMTVVINPRIAFGRPVLAGTRIPTAIIAERVATGESLDEVATDYDRQPEEILEAIRWELAASAA